MTERRPGAEQLSRLRRLPGRGGIDSISLNPDSFVATLRHVAETEQQMDAVRNPAMPTPSAAR